MNEENAKLEQIKKSTKIAGIISRVFMIMAIVGCTIALITGVIMITNPERFDKQIREEYLENDGDVSVGSGHIKLVKIDRQYVQMVKNMEMTSSVPSLQDYFDKHNSSISFNLGFYMLLIGIGCGILAAAMGIISSVFKLIMKEGNPFSDKVMKRVTISMIILSVVVALVTGLGFGVLLGFITWVVYTILDYGRTLKTLSDETL